MGLDGRAEGGSPAGLVLAGGGTNGTFCVDIGTEGDATSTGGLLFVDARLGNEPRPGGGGGLLVCDMRDGVEGGGSAPEPTGGGRPCDVCGACEGGGGGGANAACEGEGGGAGSAAIPICVFLASSGGGREARCADDPAGGGGAAGERSEDVFPRPSKISRSDPPPLLSFDIRFS